MAFGKLKGILPGRPTVFPGRQALNLLLFAAAVVVGLLLVVSPATTTLFPVLIALSALFGILLVVPIGGADMPTVISLLNSYAGLSGAAMGFVLDNKALIIAGCSRPRERSSWCSVTGWRSPRPSTRSGRSARSWNATGPGYATPSIRSRAACPAT
ncbi:NAD(P)(+) transhydrogenase (Re/Si-specific) subunit beta [Microbispora sp. GKU 823]|uniref:NAD(P)(+) transhydrogenase (Re/Si-specific) subunit beta n=1 Tax=Microbispora sp. GKU 823 TaxID=1652100 RepID=UPI002117A570|nr:NAD(P)(+) transhydrogenase (Re/Si-specific) subunit beta [Microbispora sp. GKU 823]